MDTKNFFRWPPTRGKLSALFAGLRKQKQDLNPLEAEVEVLPPWQQGLRSLGGLTALLVVFGFGAYWLYGAAKVWRAHMLVAGLSNLPAQQANAEREGKLIAAYNLAPHDAAVLRAYAGYELATGNIHSLQFYHLLIMTPQATREDQRDALRACLQFGELPAANELAEALTAKNPDSEDEALAAEVRWQERESTVALELMRASLALEPDNRPHQLLLAKMLLLSGSDEEAVEGMALLRKLAQTNDEDGLKALMIMSRHPGLDETTRRSLLKQLQQHPLLDDQARLAIWELEAGLTGADPKAVLQGAVDFFKTTDLSRQIAAARWLFYQEQEPELTLELATLPAAADSQDLLFVRLDALASLNQWSEVEKELDDPRLPLPQSMIARYRARAAQEMGDPAKSQANWEQARFAAASEGPVALADLGNYELALGLYDEAKKTFNLLAQTPAQAQAGYAALLQVESQHGSDAELLATLKQMMTDLPEEPEPQNDWAYLNLLLDTHVEESYKIARGLVGAHPRMLAYRSTLALGCLRRNDVTGAEQIYQGLVINWPAAPASWKLIHVAVLAASGNKNLASAYALNIDRSQLRPEELALLDFYVPAEDGKTRH